MIKMLRKKYLVIIVVFFAGPLVPSNAQVASNGNSLHVSEVISLAPSAILINPDNLVHVWIDEPIPLSLYTEKDITDQLIINNAISDKTVTYDPMDQQSEWLAVDHEEITPYTWKWIHLELPESDGSMTKISLRRPNWWIRELKADSIGRTVYMNLPSMGAQGWAIVTKISPNQLDMRVWDDNRNGDFVNRPITGKFTHESDDVYDLYFEGYPEPLGVTATHPIWSLDNEGWVEANTLSMGEKVKTYTGQSTLLHKKKREGRHTVYTLEVYKDHNFFVSNNQILVHNESWNQYWRILRSDIENFKKVGEEFGLSLKEHSRSGKNGDTWRRLYEYKGYSLSLEEVLESSLEDGWIHKAKKVIVKADLTDVSDEEINQMSETAGRLGFTVSDSEHDGVRYLDMFKRIGLTAVK